MGNVTNYVWILPRPRADHYPGGFPQHFESKLLKFLNVGLGAKILHPFGGMAEYGIRVDLARGPKPDIVANAECLPFRDNTFDLVILDPPYSDQHAKKLYNAPPARFRRYTTEAIRVCKGYGFICFYHWYMTPRLEGTKLKSRLVILQRIWGRPRIATICQKDTAFHL